MQLTFTSGLYLVAIIQCIFLVFFAPRHKGRWLLIVFLVTICLLLSNYMVWENGWLMSKSQRWVNRFTHSSLMYLIGPAFYFYVQIQFKPDLNLRLTQCWHLLPYLLSLCLTIFVLPYYDVTSDNYADHWLLPPVVWPSIFRGIHLIIYSIVTARVIFNVLLPGKKSTVAQRLLIVILLLGFCTSLLTTASYLVDQTSTWKLELKNSAIMGVICCIYLVNRLFISLVPQIKQNDPAIQDGKNLKKRQSSLKYQHSPIDQDSAEVLYSLLIDFMKTNRPYENPELSLPQLAKSISLTPNKLSQIINQNGGQTFYEFINFYRIEAACQLLVDKKQDHLSIEGIGYQVGFRAKSTFYEAFKKWKGLTPREFKIKKMVKH